VQLNAKLKHAIAASLSVVLAFLFPLYFGISDTSSAAITVMVIAANDTLSSSLSKGVYRVLGTFLGAVIGMVLIALFPQERMVYLFILSVLVSLVLYVARAYRGDKTIFLLTAMTMMMMFDGGEVDDIFLTAINKTLMTIIGILIYTFVSVYIFPYSTTRNTQQEEEENRFAFIWFDTEDIKGALVAFFIFWLSSFMWIYFEIPNGFFVVILATSLSLFTVYSVASGFALSILYTFSFVVATISYVFILPNLEGWWSLSLFLFVYSFIGFYFINPQISVFYLLGMSTFMIQNEMYYDFGLFLFVLLIFYLFLFVLLVFDYFPFNQKSEHMFVQLQKRFIHLLEHNPNSVHLKETLQKMYFYANKIDYEYFGIKKEELMEYCTLCKEALETKQSEKLFKSSFDVTPLKVSRF